MANTSITLEELRVLYNKWRTAWRPAYCELADKNVLRASFCVPEAYKYIKVFSSFNPNSEVYPYYLDYEGLVDNMPNPLPICISAGQFKEHYIEKVDTRYPNFRCYKIEPTSDSSVNLNNPLQIFIRMEEV